MKTVSHLRVSTQDQDLDKDKSDILLLAHKKDLGQVTFIEERVSGVKSWKTRKLNEIIDDLGQGDNLIFTEFSRIGRSLFDIMEVLSVALRKGINIYTIKSNWSLDNSLNSKIMAMAFAIAAEIERELISDRTKRALRARKAKGLPMGRPKGPGKSKLDPHKDEIVKFLENGSTKTFVAKKFGITLPNLLKWLKKRNIKIDKKF